LVLQEKSKESVTEKSKADFMKREGTILKKQIELFV